MNATVDPLADRIADVLGPIHRGVIRIADEGRFVVFGNDGYSDPGVRQIVARMARRLRGKGYGVESLHTDAEGHAWALVLAPDDYGSSATAFRKALASIFLRLWRVWLKTPNG